MAKILVVDDEQHMTALVRRRLETHGHEVEECWTGGSALEKVMAGSYELLLVDYSMPQMRGDELCQEIRDNQKFANLPIIIVTAFSNRDAESFISAGATDVVYKPIDNEELMEKIDKCLQKPAA